MNDFCSSGWFQVMLQLCGGLGQLGVECWHVTSCSVIKRLKRLAYGGAALVPMAVLTSWRKCLSMNERFLFFRMVSSNAPIVWRLGATGGRVLACNFM